MNPTLRFAVRLGLVLVSAVVLQVGVFSQVTVAGGRPVVLLLLAVAGGCTLGPERGAVVGFAAGLAFDLLTTAPVGLSAGVFCVAGHLTGRYRPAARRLPWWQFAAVVGLASALAYLGLVVTGWILGQRGMAPERLAASLLVVSVVNAALAPLARTALAWAGSTDDRLTMVGVPRGG
jgi:rod shape-determining protein MreD